MGFDLGSLAIGRHVHAGGGRMKAAGKRRTWLCAMLPSLLAACTHSDHGSMNARADHWMNIGQVAIVAARDGDAYLTASCYYGPTVALMSTVKVSDRPEARILALGFDGSTPVPQNWKSRAYAAPRWGFETGGAKAADFPQTLARLRKSGEAEAVVEEAGREVLHVHFSLAGAGDALTEAFKNCPP